jgi:hypothetical protein
LEHTQETKSQYNLSLGYDKTMLSQFLVFIVLPNLRKQVSLIYLLSILNISQREWNICFRAVTYVSNHPVIRVFPPAMASEGSFCVNDSPIASSASQLILLLPSHVLLLLTKGSLVDNSLTY